jgi:hypothetical protein
MCPAFQLNVSHLDYDGEQFGTRTTSLKIPQFSGAEKITKLNVCPLSLNPRGAELISDLTSRGFTFESLAGQNFQCYKGIAAQLGCPVTWYSVDGRVLVCPSSVNRTDWLTRLTMDRLVWDYPLVRFRAVRQQSAKQLYYI